MSHVAIYRKAGHHAFKAYSITIDKMQANTIVAKLNAIMT